MLTGSTPTSSSARAASGTSKIRSNSACQSRSWRLPVLRINETTHQPPTNAQQKQWYYPQNCSWSLESWPSLLLSNFFSTFCSLLVTNILGWPARHKPRRVWSHSQPANQPTNHCTQRKLVLLFYPSCWIGQKETFLKAHNHFALNVHPF